MLSELLSCRGFTPCAPLLASWRSPVGSFTVDISSLDVDSLPTLPLLPSPPARDALQLMRAFMLLERCAPVEVLLDSPSVDLVSTAFCSRSPAREIYEAALLECIHSRRQELEAFLAAHDHPYYPSGKAYLTSDPDAWPSLRSWRLRRLLLEEVISSPRAIFRADGCYASPALFGFRQVSVPALASDDAEVFQSASVFLESMNLSDAFGAARALR